MRLSRSVWYDKLDNETIQIQSEEEEATLQGEEEATTEGGKQLLWQHGSGTWATCQI